VATTRELKLLNIIEQLLKIVQEFDENKVSESKGESPTELVQRISYQYSRTRPTVGEMSDNGGRWRGHCDCPICTEDSVPLRCGVQEPGKAKPMGSVRASVEEFGTMGTSIGSEEEQVSPISYSGCD